MFPIFLINFLLAISTTVGMTIIPFLITDSLGMSLLVLGLIEGMSEFLSNLCRLGNGILFDKIKNKRLIFVCSTFLALMSKTMLLLPSSWGVLCAKILERIANGTFASPRDAYVASKAKNKGMALGFLNVSKTIGCVLGPLMVSGSTFFLGSLKDNIHIFVIFCCVLAFPAFLLSFNLKIDKIEEKTFSLAEVKSVLKSISPILLVCFLFFLGRFNDGLIMIYLKKNNFPEWFYLSTIAIFNSIMLISSPFIGKQIDKGRLTALLYCTSLALLVFNIAFYQLNLYHIGSMAWILAIVGLMGWGIQRASAQIVFASFVFNSVKKENYGTAIGIFYIFTGVASMAASFMCGYTANVNISNIFLFSGSFSLLALVFSRTLLPKIMRPIAAETSYA